MELAEETAQVYTKFNAARERELYRYFHPEQHCTSPESTEDSYNTRPASQNQIGSDPQLLALAQLTALRLDATRAVISVIDQEHQYFLAEATQSTNLGRPWRDHKEDDPLFFSCDSAYPIGCCCDVVIRLPYSMDAQRCLTIPDLRRDSRSKDHPAVTSSPGFRYYAGVPISTKRKIHIGTLFLVDQGARPALTHDQERLLHACARLVMNHLECKTEANSLKRLMRTTAGLNAFVEGKGRSDVKNAQRKIRKPSVRSGELVTKPVLLDRELNLSPLSTMKPVQAGALEDAASEQLESSSETSADEDDPENTDSSNPQICRRAAKLLAESLKLQKPWQDGGVVYLDATSTGRQKAFASSRESLRASTSAVTAKPADVIGQSGGISSFKPMNQVFLQSLLRRYPQGKLWSYDADDGTLSSSEEDATELQSMFEKAERRANLRDVRRQEVAILRDHFPGSRQVLFTGLWDVSSSRWHLGAFAWTMSKRHVFSLEVDLTLFKTFGTAVMAEISRQSSIAADQQKSAFISSISHELRSPLHGILAGAEFMSETTTTPFQSSLIDIIASCGRTLNDTMSHILDYSKINSFETKRRSPRGSRADSASSDSIAKKAQGPSILNVTAKVNVAALAEEVIEGVCAGQLLQDISSDAQLHSVQSSDYLEKSKPATIKDVKIILNFEPADYTFTTQPGAFRRIIMNIFGNALKYTFQGSIVIKLAVRSSDETTTEEETGGRRLLEIEVNDTGKGISSDYLRTKLFRPFSQEDSLASGTGLGLSIVRSICNVLGGDINVQSRQGEGTEVTIRLPMTYEPRDLHKLSRRLSNPIQQSHDILMNSLRQTYGSATVCLYGFEHGNNRILEKYVGVCIREWYGMKTASGPSSSTCDLLILDEKAIEFARTDKSNPAYQSVPTVLLCGLSYTLRNSIDSSSRRPHALEFLTKPFGPYKLARALYACLQKAEVARANPTLTLNLPSPAEASQIRDLKDIEPSFGGGTLMTVPQALSQKDDLAEDQGHRPSTLKRLRDLSSTVEPSTADSTPVRVPQAHLFGSDAKAKREVSGSEFQPDLQTPSPLPELPITPLMPPLEQPQKGARKPRLLLVDDNNINIRLLETYIQRRELAEQVDLAENGLLAVQAVEKQAYDVIFMDISMPIMNGFEATQEIRKLEWMEEERGVPVRKMPAMIVALTGVASGEDQQEAFASGVDDFMTKPVSFKEVGKLLVKWKEEH